MEDAKTSVTTGMMQSARTLKDAPTIDHSLQVLEDANQHLSGCVNRLRNHCSQVDGEDAADGAPDTPRPVISGQRHILADKVSDTARLAQQIDHLLGRLSDSLG